MGCPSAFIIAAGGAVDVAEAGLSSVDAGSVGDGFVPLSLPPLSISDGGCFWRLRRRRMRAMYVMSRTRMSPPIATPTPMPILVPELKLEVVPPPCDVVLPLFPPVPLGEELAESTVDDVIVEPLDVKTVTEVLPAFVEPPFVEDAPDVAVPEPFAPEELSSALVEPEVCVGAADPDAADPEVGSPVGTWPTKNWMLSPVFWGSEAMFVRLAESLNAIVADDATVQLQYAPFWRVEGSPD